MLFVFNCVLNVILSLLVFTVYSSTTSYTSFFLPKIPRRKLSYLRWDRHFLKLKIPVTTYKNYEEHHIALQESLTAKMQTIKSKYCSC